jgi:hypothetical protein
VGRGGYSIRMEMLVLNVCILLKIQHNLTEADPGIC